MILIITHLSFTFIGFLIARYFYLNKSYIRGKEDGAFEKEKSIFYNEISNVESLNSELLNNKLEINFIKGKEFGILEERKKINIRLTPKMEIKDNFFKKKATTGYELQVTYNGFPIGNPQYNNLEKIEKFKDENLKYTIDKVNQTILTLADMYMEKQLEVIKLVLSKSDIKNLK
jgi:hypothetical protein